MAAICVANRLDGWSHSQPSLNDGHRDQHHPVDSCVDAVVVVENVDDDDDDDEMTSEDEVSEKHAVCC
jgi:hypothetical protein